jgi:predicted transcriptional regulator of viral defense system
MLQTVGIDEQVPTQRTTSKRPTRAGVLRQKDLAALGVSRTAVGRMTRAGKLERVGRGLYVPRGAKLTEHHSLAEASKRVPHGVVCLLSALAFHGMGTQSPHEVWLAIDVKARKPALGDGVPLHIVRFSGKARTHGVERHVVEGVEVQITSRPKTVADCFKYREKLGIDVALEALKAYLGKRGRSMDALLEAAAVCRVANVMRPYIEALS